MPEQTTEFFLNHPILTAAWVAIAGALIWTFRETSRGGQRVTPAQATRLINGDDALVLDVRTASEFNDGHILNAKNIAVSDLNDQLPSLEKHKDQPLIVACRSGQQSTNAANILRKAGFSKVYNLGGGIMAWQEASLPLSKHK